MHLPRLSFNLSSLATKACYLGPAVMVAADTVTIALNHTFSPLKQTISGFAAGPDGWLERIGIAVVALSFFLIALNVLTTQKKNHARILTSSGVLLVIVAIGFLMLSIFNTNVIATLASFHGLVHQISSAAVSVVFYAACLIMMGLMINKPGFRFFAIYSGITFVVGVTVLTLLVAGFYQDVYTGLMERGIAGFNMVWIVLVGPQVIRLARE
jgi:hypothetical protein